MALSHWYFGTISKVTANVLDMFNDITIKQNKYNETTSSWTLTSYSVPLEIATKSKILNEYQQEQLTSGIKRYSNIPRMSLMLNSINKEELFQTNSMNKYKSISNSINSQGGESFSFLRNPTWYTAEYTLFIITRKMDDMCQIIEQLVAQFQPQKSLNIKLINSLDLRISLPLTIDTSIAFDINEETDETALRLINVEIPIRVPIPFFPPISTSAVIKEIHTRFGTIVGNDEIYQLQEFFRFVCEKFESEIVNCTADVTETITRI